MSMCPRTEHGTSLLEIIVALGLGSVVIAGALQIFLALRSYEHSTLLEARDAATLERSAAYINYLLTAADTHPFSFGVRVHHNGDILFPDGLRHEIMNAPTALRPAPGSDALTAMFLDASSPLRVERIIVDRENLLVRACFMRASSASLEGIHTVVGMTSSHAAEFSVQSIHGQGRCRAVALQQTRSISLPAALQLQPHLLLPILSHLTLYLSTEGELRLLGHRGEEISENQPVENGISELRIELQAFGPSSLIAIDGHLTLISNRTRKIHASATLAKGAPLNGFVNL